MVLDVRFFGVPRVFLDDQELEIPQKKLFALLLYIVYHTRCSRDELVSIFWSQLSEANARQNLRNALYRLKGHLRCDLFAADNQSISLRPELEVHRDTDLLIEDDGGLSLLQLDSVVFLDQLTLRDTPEFDKWVLSMQAAHEKIIVDRLERNMREYLLSGGTEAEDCAKKLLSVSPYHEEAARTLIQRYASRGQYTDAIHVYTQLSNCLQEDLGISPEQATQDLHESILELRDAHKLESQDWAVSQRHGHALDSIRLEYNHFLSGLSYRHCFLMGATGSGKSIVLQNFVQELKPDTFIRVRFEFVNSDIPYYAIGKILPRLADLCKFPLTEPSYNDFETLKLYHIISMDKLISRMSSRNLKILILLENLEAADQRSVEIIFSHLLDKCNGKIMIVGEYCTSFSANHQTAIRLKLLDNVRVLPLPPLSLQETVAYLSKITSHQISSQLDANEIWKQTGGNLVMLTNVAENLKTRRSDPFKASTDVITKLTILLSSLSYEERHCLEVLSIFRYGVEVKTLAAIMGIHTSGLIDTIEHLYQRDLISEEKYESHLLAKFSVEMLRIAVYSQMSLLRRTELHRAAAEYFKTSTRPASLEYHHLRELKYHYSMVGQSYEQVYYDLEELRYRLDYCDGFFPSLQSDPAILATFYLSKPDIYKEFERIESMLDHLGSRLTPDQNRTLEMTYKYLKGRTLIRDSRYSEGLSYINEVIAAAEYLQREDMLLKGYLEVVFGALRMENQDLMRTYIAKARSLPSFSKAEYTKGVLLRLEGMCEIMSWNYEAAKSLLHSSIHVLENPRLRGGSSINIAAAYDYLGIIHRSQKDYDSAIKAIEKAIALCKQNNVKKSLDVFYQDLGYTYFLQGDYQRAKDSFKHSIEIYNQFDSNWLRSVCESCMAMISAKEGNSQDALEYYRRAEIYSRKNHTIQELKILSQAQKELVRAQIL